MLTLSVVIPTRNTRALTERCVTAVLDSTACADAVIVVDDGGTDGTAESLRAAFPAVQVLESPVSVGFTRAVNNAWATLATDLVLVLNSDTEIAPDALARFRDAFARDPRLGVAGAALRFPDGRPQWSAGPYPGPLWLFAAASGLPAALARIPGIRQVRPERQASGVVPWVPATAMVVRRDVVAAIGRFDEAYAFYAQDLAYCLDAARHGWRVAVVAEAVVRHHRGATIGASAAGAAPRLEIDPVAMSRDLWTWLRQRGDWRQRAAWRWGLRVRVAVRRLAVAGVAPAERAAWRALTARYREALRLIASR